MVIIRGIPGNITNREHVRNTRDRIENRINHVDGHYWFHNILSGKSIGQKFLDVQNIVLLNTSYK